MTTTYNGLISKYGNKNNDCNKSNSMPMHLNSNLRHPMNNEIINLG